ncbi:MAG: SRPBCC family protein [Cellulophaga sp.]
MNILQIALLSNAIFSVSTGLFLLVFRNKVAQWFGQQNATVFLIIGFGLLYFSYSIFKELKNPEPEAVFYIIVQDLIWILLSMVILKIKPFNIAILGNQIITGIAVIVFLFSIGQSIGLAQLNTTMDKNIKILSFERAVNASKKNTWKTVSDVSNYHKVASNIDRVEIISGKGKGMVRNCSHKTDNWTEVATLWEEGEQYSFQVNTGAENYPYPLKYLKGTWKVEEISKNKTKITMIFEFTYKWGIYNLILHPFMKKEFDKICEEILDNWQNQLEQQ